MSELNITVPAGQKKRLLTAGKYCEDNIVVTADGIDTSDATAAAGDIVAGKTAYVDDEKVVGTFTIDDELQTQDGLIAQIQTALSGKAAGSEPELQEKTVTPTTSSQTVRADNGYDGLSKVTINAIPSSYVQPTATKAATTYTPTTSNQTIAAGTYCSGVQTIKGDANLVAGNIKSGVSIFGVNGNYEGSGGDSGGGIETCTLSITGNAPAFESYIWYTDGSSSAKSIPAPDFKKSITVTVMKNSIFFTTNIFLHIYDESVCQRLDSRGGFYGYFISGDASGETA